MGGQDFMHIFKKVSSRCKKEEVELFAEVARRIWLRRNDLVHGGTFTHPSLLLKSAENALEEFQRLNVQVEEQEDKEKAPEMVVLQPPPRGSVKLNWDASLDLQEKKLGLGIVARDKNGKFIVAYSKQQPIGVSPITR
jgi:hypothetical protein